MPTERQLNWFELGFYGFVHFTVNTYTGRELGLGDEDPAIFNPYDLDCDEWVLTMQEAGMKGVILTAKHHSKIFLRFHSTLYLHIHNTQLFGKFPDT